MAGSYSFQYYDLDLDHVERTEDPEELVSIFGQLISGDSDFKVVAARSWTENMLYYCGMRDTGSRFNTSTVQGSPMNFVSPGVGNYTFKRRIPKLFKAVQVMASNTTRQRPSIKVWPDGDDEVSDAKAKLSNILLDYYWDPDCEDDMNYEAMLWALLTPAVARKDYISHKFNKSRLWPLMEQGMDPMTGQPQSTPKMDGDGRPMLQQLPWNESENISAYRLIFNPTANWTTSLDFVGDVSVRRISYLRQNFLRYEEGYLPHNVEKLKPGNWRYTSIMGMESALKQLTFGMFRATRNWNYAQVSMKDGVVCGNFFVVPSARFPYGREIFVANGLLLYDGKPRMYREDPVVVWHPYSFLTYERVPGRLWGTSYAEKLIDLQRSYEQARSEFDQLRRTMAKPKLAMPIGAQLDRDTITGNEEVWRYNAFGPAGGKPEFMSPPPANNVITDDIKMMQGEWTEISGVTEIMQGIRPQGVTTYRGLEVLREESNNSQSNFIRCYEQFIQNCQSNKLYNIRSCLVYPNQDLTNALKTFKKMKQYITDIDIQDFVGGQLGGSVIVEPMSSIGKSQLAMQEKYSSMAQMGVLGDIVNDPDLNQEFKRKQGVIGFDKPQDKQVILARYENQMMLQADEKQTIINPPVYDYHDDALHIREVENLLLDPSLQNKPLIVQSLLTHRKDHEESMAIKQMKALQQQMQMQMAGPPGMPPPGPGGMPPKPQGGPPKMGGGNGSGPATQANHGKGGPPEAMFGPETGFASGGGNVV